MTGTATAEEYSFRGGGEEFGVFLLHTPDMVQSLAGVLTGAPNPRVVELYGDDRSGRHYLMRAAAFEASRRGVPVRVESIDLDGYEPGHPMESMLRYLGTKTGSPTAQGMLDLIRGGDVEAELLVKPFNFLFAELAIKVEMEAADLAAFFAPKRSGVPMSERERLRRLVDRLTEHGRLVLHVRDGRAMDVCFRADLIDEARLNPKLSVAFSHPSGATPIPEPEPTHAVRVARWSLDAANAALGRRFARGRSVEEFLDFLCRTAKSRQAAAGVVWRMTRTGAIIPDQHGPWRLNQGWERDRMVIEEFARDVFDPLMAMEKRLRHQAGLTPEDLRRLELFWSLAALCQPTIPIKRVAMAAGVTPDQLDVFVEWIDETLGTDDDGIFEDLGFSHPGFPEAELLYRFRNPLMPGAILLRRDDVDGLAARLLGALRAGLPPVTRAVARLYMGLALTARAERDSEEWQRQLAWWVEFDRTEELTAEVVRWMEEGEVSPDLVWNVVQKSKDVWTYHRRLAVLEAYRAKPDGVAADQLFEVFLLRAELLYYCGRYPEALESAEIARDSPWPQPEWLSEARVCRLQGEVETPLRSYASARGHLMRARELFEGHLPPNHVNLGSTLNALGQVEYSEGRHEQARELVARALSICEEALGPKHPSVAVTLQDLACVDLAEGRHEQARELFVRALAIKEEALGPKHPEVATTLYSLARVEHAEGRHEQARELFLRALAIEEEALGPRHPEVAATLHELALVELAEGRHDQARELLERALAIHEETLGPRHPEVATTLHELARVELAEGRHDQARELFERALSTEEETLGADHPDVAATRQMLASLDPVDR